MWFVPSTTNWGQYSLVVGSALASISVSMSPCPENGFSLAFQ